MSWPKLSESLNYPRELAICQCCGASEPLNRWIEHDEADQPTNIVVVLCVDCAEVVIESHVRLYGRAMPHQPIPGSMEICVDCIFQKALNCRHPDAQFNGGTAGIKISYPKPGIVHIDGADKKGRRVGYTNYVYPGPATDCSGKIASHEGT